MKNKIKNKIDELREHLHQAVNIKNYEEILKISQKLDKLIVEYSKRENFIKEGKG